MDTERKYKFIIIDDHPLIRDGIRNYISAHEKFEFIGEFGDTRSLLNSTFSDKPDVIILDLNLPGIDGEKSCELLKRKYPYCKILAFTQYVRREKILRDLGFDGYVVKSEKDTLIEALLSIIKGEEYFKKGENTPPDETILSKEVDAFLKVKKLTQREIEITKYILEGFSNREIGEKLFIAESTVETHRKHIKEKLNIKNKRDWNEVFKGRVG